MKKQILRSVAVFALLAVIFTGCKKYDEGPSFTLLSKKARMDNDWKLTNITENGTDITSSFNSVVSSYSWTIDKKGTYTSKISGSILGVPYTDNANGTWSFSSDKKTVTFVETSPGTTTTVYTILKLKNKEMKLQETDSSGDKYVYTFEPN